MALPIAWPLIDGSGQVINKAAFNNYDAQLNVVLTDAFSGGGAGTTRTPGQTTGEVVDARGNTASLSARLANLIGLNGENLAEVSPSYYRNGHTLGNLLANDTMMMWSRGPTSAPDYYALSGAGAAVQQCGVGLADANVLPGMDHYSARLTAAAAPAVLSQFTIGSGPQGRMGGGSIFNIGILRHNRPWDASTDVVPGYDEFYDEALYLYGVGWVLCSGAARARLRITTASGSFADSDYHSGGGEWELKIVGPIDPNSGPGAAMTFACRAETAGAAYFQGMCMVASIGKPIYVPARVRLREYTFPIIASPVAATGLGYFRPARPFHALAFAAECVGAVPTGGTTLKLDLMTPVGGTFVSLFAALPAFVASDRHVFKELDTAVANYRRRTIRGNYAAGGASNLADNSVLRLDVNTRDSGNTATNILCTVIGLEYDVPFNQFRTGADLLEA